MFENLHRIVTSEGSTVPLGELVKAAAREQKKAVKTKFVHDVLALKSAGYRIEEGEEIALDLKNALEIMPRDRKRVDAYKSLAGYLDHEFGCRLFITSQKTRKEDRA